MNTCRYLVSASKRIIISDLTCFHNFTRNAAAKKVKTALHVFSTAYKSRSLDNKIFLVTFLRQCVSEHYVYIPYTLSLEKNTYTVK